MNKTAAKALGQVKKAVKKQEEKKAVKTVKKQAEKARKEVKKETGKAVCAVLPAFRLDDPIFIS